MRQLLRRTERPTRSRTTSSRTRFTHPTIIGYPCKNRTSHLFNIQNLALQKRTCYEPLASTHPDTQGFAKDFGLSGYKVGVLYTRNPAVRDAVLSQSRMANASSDTQALLRDLLLDTTWLEQFQAEARRRLRTAYEHTTAALTAAAIPYLPATAGLFLYLDLTAHAPTFEAEAALTNRLRTEAHLNLTPGATFHTPTPGYYRLCFTTDEAEVTTAIERLSRLLSASGTL